MLYEKFNGKKYRKPLYENMKYQGHDYFSLNFDKNVIKNNNTTRDNLLFEYVNPFNLQFNFYDGGLIVYTNDLENYIKLHEKLLQDGYSKNTLISMGNGNETIVNIIDMKNKKLNS